MATFTKSRARRPIAEGNLFKGASKASGSPVNFNFNVRGENSGDSCAFYYLNVDKGEAITIAAYIAATLTRDFDDYKPDKRSLAEQIRDLADFIAAGK